MRPTSVFGSGVAVVLAILTFGGCNCDRTNVSRSVGELGISHLDPNGQVITSRDASYDFGTHAVGNRLFKKLVVKNLGGGPLTLISIERVEGDTVKIGTEAVDGAPFEVAFVPDTHVGGGESVEFDIAFAPPVNTTATTPSQDYYVKLVLSAGGTREGENTATIQLRGTAVAAGCDLPTEIDFGKVAVGDVDLRGLTFTNSAVIETTGHVGAPQAVGGAPLAFELAPGTPSGDVSIPAGGSHEVLFAFKPTEMRAYSATTRLRANSGCGFTDVTLKGEGVDTVLEWHPTSLNFGYVSPGSEAVKQVTFVNHGSSDVDVFGVQTTAPTEFAMKAEAGGNPSRLVVPGNGSAVMNVVCKPSQLGPRTADLDFQTAIQAQPQGKIALTCYGGGPEIEVIPAGTVNFGKIAYFAAANPPYSVTRRITVMNLGSTPPNNDPNGNLRLGKIATDGTPGQIPFIAVNPLNSTTTPDEISVGLPPTYNPAVGLRAQAGQNIMDLTVTLTPKSLGKKEAELVIYSNDGDEPETKLLITSEAVALPPCKYSVTPAQVNFGLVTPGTTKDVPVTFTNLGVNAGDTCLISGVDLAPGTDPSYRMPNGATPSKELGPGESFQALVRVEPTGTVPTGVVTLTGTLKYHVSSPTKPNGTVPLTTSVGPSCLTIAPAHQDFGAVKPGCSAATRTFSIYNICTQSVTLQQVSMQLAAGQAPGGPNCPGTAPCFEFQLVQTPAIPSGGLTLPPGGAPVTFQAKYKPIDVGVDNGAIAVNVVQSGVGVSYLVTLEGEGNNSGLNTDVFTQDAKPKADVLFTIDNSCSMQSFQTSLSNNFASFIAYAQSANVDWQIGVTTTDMEDAYPSPYPGIPGKAEGEKGRLIGTATNPKILTSSTPNVAALFQQKVQVGTNGSGIETGLEPSLRAITPPLSVADNAGFVRPDANLAVVVVTDAPDQSGNSAAYYVNSLLNVKGFNKANMFTFNAIAGFNPTPPSSCAGYDQGSDDGTYAAVVAQTKGIKEEICTQNWAVALQGLGKTAFGFRTTFFLTTVPAPHLPIEVKINGVILPQTTGGPPNWTYDAASNAIIFTPTTAPGPGETLEITYAASCLP